MTNTEYPATRACLFIAANGRARLVYRFETGKRLVSARQSLEMEQDDAAGAQDRQG